MREFLISCRSLSFFSGYGFTIYSSNSPHNISDETVEGDVSRKFVSKLSRHSDNQHKQVKIISKFFQSGKYGGTCDVDAVFNAASNMSYDNLKYITKLRDKLGRSILWWASTSNENIELARLLVNADEKKESLNIGYGPMMTPLTMAINSKSYRMAALLLSNGGVSDAICVGNIEKISPVNLAILLNAGLRGDLKLRWSDKNLEESFTNEGGSLFYRKEVWEEAKTLSNAYNEVKALSAISSESYIDGVLPIYLKYGENILPLPSEIRVKITQEFLGAKTYSEVQKIVDFGTGKSLTQRAAYVDELREERSYRGSSYNSLT